MGNSPDLPNNFPLAFNQLKILIKCLERDNEMLAKCKKAINEDQIKNYIK